MRRARARAPSFGHGHGHGHVYGGSGAQGQVPGAQLPLASLTQMLSQSVLQQYGSNEQTSVAHVLQELVSLEPDEHTECLHDPPPPPLLEPELLPLLEPELPPLLLPPPVHDEPQYVGTSLTQMLSHWVLQQ